MAKWRPKRIPGHTHEREQATKTGFALDTLRRWRRKGHCQAYVKIGREIFYVDADEPTTPTVNRLLGDLPRSTMPSAGKISNARSSCACNQCGEVFVPRQHTGGSVQRFCCTSCRLGWHKQRQRSQRMGSYAGEPSGPDTPQAKANERLPRKIVTGQLNPWETGVLDIADSQRTEFVVALNEGEAAGTRVETWPPEVRALIDDHVSRWVEEHKQTCIVRAVTVAAPKYEGIQSCVVILHHRPKHDACADSSGCGVPDGALPGQEACHD